jgi:hypothetical protein
MPVTTEWYDDTQTILHMRFTEPWTISEMSEAIHAARLNMQDVAHMVDLIFDIGQVQRIPANIITHFALSREDSHTASNQRYVVVVVQNRYISSLVAVSKRMLPAITQKMLMVNTLDEAIEVLRKRLESDSQSLENS